MRPGSLTLGVFALLVLAAPARAQLVWARAGTPPPSRWESGGPLPYGFPYVPEVALWDESRARVLCSFLADRNLGGAAAFAEFDGETWLGGTPYYLGALRGFTQSCPDPRGNGRSVLFGGISGGLPFLSTTEIWDPTQRAWVLINPAHVPPARAGGCMALLPGVGAVLFGGQITFGGAATDATWIWDGVDWREVITSPRPSPRTDPTMAFDPIGQRLLLFGGSSQSDTWAFNGSTWTQLFPATSPPAVTYHRAVTDPERGTVVLCGGTAWYSGLRNDTWTWNGSNWIQRTPAHAPPLRRNAATVWDSKAKRVLLIGGIVDGSPTGLTDVWAWDGNDWSEVLPADRGTVVQPPARAFATLAHDAQLGRTILHGGIAAGLQSTPLSDTWIGRDRLWGPAAPGTRPPLASTNAGALHRGTGSLFYVPGNGSGGTYNEIWSCDGSLWNRQTLNSAPITPIHQVLGSLYSSQLGWVFLRLVTSDAGRFWRSDLQLIVPGTGIVQPMFPTGGPGPRYGSAMVQADSPFVVTNRVWLFGGGDVTTNFADVWELADTGVGGNLAWTQLVPAAGSPQPPGRIHAAAAYHPGQNRIYVMGGQASGPLGDSWTFDLGTRWWTPISGGGPAPRFGASMTYDPSLDRIVLIGGTDGGTSFDDMWECDGASWTQRATPGRPLARTWATLGYDPARQRSLLFGGGDGQSVFGDLWSYDGRVWSPIVTPGVAPSRRFVHTACFDEAHGALVVHGGSADGVQLLDDTWRFDGAQWSAGAGGPSARVNASMAYAIYQGLPSCILFGGYDVFSSFLGDCWRYDVSTDAWAPLAGGPSSRDIHAMAWDRARNAIVLFGGRSYAGFHDDTWELNLATGTWAERFPAHRPPVRTNHAMAFDAGRARIVLFGGYNGGYLNDVWEWNGIDWTQRIAETASPVPQEDPTLAYDSARGRLVSFGGWDGARLHGSLWELHARIDTAGAGNTTAPLPLRFYSQPALGQTLRFGFDNATAYALWALDIGPKQQPVFSLAPPTTCEASDIYAAALFFSTTSTAESNIVMAIPNSPLILGYSFVFQAFPLQAAQCWRATDALQVRF